MLANACRFSQDKASLAGINTIEGLCTTHPERIRSLLEALELQQAGLSNVVSNLTTGDTVAACKHLLHYFSKAKRDWVVSTLDSFSKEEALSIAGALLYDSVTFNGAAGKVPNKPDGGWQWDYTGPEKDDEFGYSLNGHRYLPALFTTWCHNHNRQWVTTFDRIIQDWILQHPLPGKEDSIYLVLESSNDLDWRDIGEVEWRTLEAGNRLGASWPQLFYGFQPHKSFREATRLLMLASMAEQAAYLQQYHKKGHNWTTMEMNGLALVALAFPEFKNAQNWKNYALQVMSEEINRQVYPDGVQTEISTKTQWVALQRFESVADHFQLAGETIPEPYWKRIVEMYNYLAYSMRPDGHQPLNNDSDREDLRPRVLSAATKFNRPDWQWIASNGKLGNLPPTEPSVVFPWAGIHVMRNGWHDQAHWAFFDTGPYGTGHQHRDKLHLSIAAFGKDLLVDGGRYTHKDYFSFDPTHWRGYFRSSFSHNVVLVDGKGQNGGNTLATAPLDSSIDYFHHPEYDYAHGIFDDGFEEVPGKVRHARSVLYLRDKFWVVLDFLETDRPRQIQALWHYAPSCRVEMQNKQAISLNPEQGNLRIIPLGNISWQPAIFAGQEKPVIQGWYSADYGVKVPSPTCVYSAAIDGNATFGWLLVPALGPVPVYEATWEHGKEGIKITIHSKNESPTIIVVPLDRQAANIKIQGM